MAVWPRRGAGGRAGGHGTSVIQLANFVNQ